MKRRKIADVITFVVLLTASVMAVIPILWTFHLSIKPEKLLYSLPPVLRFRPSLEHYVQVFTYYPFANYIVNSIMITVLSTLISLAIAFPAAYSMGRFRTGGTHFSFWVLSIRMLPPIVFAVPMFLLIQSYGLLDTWWALILVYLTFNIPLAVWILMSFIEDLPEEAEEAAMLDGCSRVKAMVLITFPLIAPALIAVAILNFIFSWNDFLFALILTFTEARTVQVGVAEFVTGYAIIWGAIAAAGCIAVVPTLVFTMFARRYLVRGLTMGTVRQEI
jgi:multiple sugar transport system permease protein